MRKILSLLLTILCILSLVNITEVHADDVGYYYQKLHVDVYVNEAREYEITEHMEVYYTDEMHGIIRSIPTYSNVENYIIEDITLQGAEYEVEYGYSDVEIKIGSEDILVEGLQTYELRYTLKHYQDYDDFYDYMYLNILGNDYDTYVDDLSATITFAPSLSIEEYTVTSGPYSSYENQYIKAEQDGQVITLQSIETIPNYEAATVQVRLPQGSFSQAPEYVFPYVINDQKVWLEINKELEYTIKQQYTVTAAYDTSMHLDYEIDGSYGASKIKDVEISGNVEYYAYDSFASFSLRQGVPHTFTVEYTMRPNSLYADTEYYFVNGYEDTKVEDLEIYLNAPIIPNYTLEYNRYGDEINTSRYTIQETDTTWSLKSNGTVQAGEHVVLTMDFPKDTFYRPISLGYYILLAVGAVLVGLAAILRGVFSGRRDLVTPITFYPPRGLNSAEVGYIYDDTCSDSDITSLLFLWASKGYMMIHEDSKGDYSFERLQDITWGEVEEYEHQLFNATFSHGSGDIVEKSDLKHSYYKDVNVARKAIKAKYSKEQALYSNSANIVKYSILVICSILLVALIAMNINTGGEDAIISAIFLIPVVLLLTLFPVFKRSNIIAKIVIGSMILIFGGVSVIISLAFMNENTYITIAIMAVLLVAMLLAMRFKKYSEYGASLVGEILGFRDFLIAAEKPQLEALLEDDPQYYYAILPYAQCLGVTKIWRDKFIDITMEPPIYYYGDGSYTTFIRMHDGVNRQYNTVTHAPHTSSSSSNYTGGGGGFSGGGFSGGGSGGGGSRGW